MMWTDFLIRPTTKKGSVPGGVGGNRPTGNLLLSWKERHAQRLSQTVAASQEAMDDGCDAIQSTEYAVRIAEYGATDGNPARFVRCWPQFALRSPYFVLRTLHLPPLAHLPWLSFWSSLRSSAF